MTVADFAALNSATKYPSIATYHTLDPKTGRLTEPAMQFTGDVISTEKLDGTNGRIVLMQDGDYFIGERENLIYAKGDRILAPNLGIVATLKPLADRIVASREHGLDMAGPVIVLFLEVYGGKVGGNAKQYTSTATLGYRLFDYAVVASEVLSWPRERIASWREHGGQEWGTEAGLQWMSEDYGIPLVPRLGAMTTQELPSSLEGMYKWLIDVLPTTNVALDEGALGRAEGVVLRTVDRSVIAKARFQDYERTLQLRRPKGR
jgi:hypothetical protein